MSRIRVHDWLSRLTTVARGVRSACGRVLRQVAVHSRGESSTTASHRPARRFADAGDLLWSRIQNRLHMPAQVLAWVAGATVARYVLGADDTAATLLFYPVVVATAAWRAGWTGGVAASLGAVAAIHAVGDPSGWTTVLFAGEAFAITGVVVSLTAQLRERTDTLDAANRRIGELQAADARARTRDVAARLLEAQSPEHAIVLLDRQGLIVDWRAGAAAMFGLGLDAVRSNSAAALFPEGQAGVSFRSLLAEAQQGQIVRTDARLRRVEGKTFEAEIELAMTVGEGGDGFALVVRDKTLEHERRASTTAMLAANHAFRAEADMAQRQLAALQSVTDPSLNAWAPSDLVSELLERGRLAVQADGIALVLLRDGAPRVLSTPEGLHPDGPIDRLRAELDRQATSRVVLVQNDCARVAEQSLLHWPDGTASLMSVPVVYGGDVEGTVEVVDRHGRRSTEWEIALLQVVAARIAGLARSRRYEGSAVA